MPDEIPAAAVEVARTAGAAVAAARFRAGSPISRKADGSEVTTADVEVERLIRRCAGDVLTSNGHLHDQLLDLVAGLPELLLDLVP